MNMDAATKINDFTDYSKEIACHFLQTAVTVDDKLIMSSDSYNSDYEINDVPDDGIGAIDAKSSEKTLIDHNLDYQTLSIEFAKKGIICSGLTPRASDSREDKIKYITEVIKNSDLAIIDWEIGDKGELAVEVISKVANEDFNSGGQLRLICVYTGSNEKDISKKIGNKIASNNLVVRINESHIDVCKKAEKSFWRVVIVSKNPAAKGSAEEDLPDKLIGEFSKITAGLLSNALLSSIGEIRNSTHKLLARFNSGLDSAYISHLIGLMSLEKAREQAHQNAFDYAADLIAEQLKSEIQVSGLLKKALSQDVIGTWPEWKNPDKSESHFEIKISDKETKKFNNDVAKRMLTFVTKEDALKVLNDDFSLKSNSKLKEFEKNSVEFKCNGENNEIYVELSALEVCRRDRYPGSNSDEFIPVLKQGSVIKDINCEKFYVCLQPLCDSVRLTENTFFLFIEAFESENFTQALRTEDGYLKLRVDPKTSYVRSFSFRPCMKSRVILGKKFNSKYIFIASHNNMNFNIQFEWLGELKNSIAQSLATNLTGQLSRIGIDTFEWLRLRK